MIRWLACLAVFLSASQPAHAASTFDFIGTAKSGDTKNVLYQEQHRITGACTKAGFEPDEHTVEYRKGPAESRFAIKTLRYDERPSRPSVDFRQPHFGESLTITYPEKNQLAIAWRPPSGDRKNFRVRYDDQLVVDAGFDHFVRANWQAVTAGKSLSFQFLAPTRGDHYGFVLEPAPAAKMDADVVVQIRPTSLVLRFLVDPIILGYNQRGALTHYQGLTNIRANSETNYTANIHYRITQYPDCELTF